MEQIPTRWSPGNQFCFIDGYAYSVDNRLQVFRLPEKDILPYLDGKARHPSATIDNLITLDIIQRSKNAK